MLPIIDTVVVLAIQLWAVRGPLQKKVFRTVEIPLISCDRCSQVKCSQVVYLILLRYCAGTSRTLKEPILPLSLSLFGSISFFQVGAVRISGVCASVAFVGFATV